MSATRESGQSKKLYTHAYELSDELFSWMGIMEGKIDFHHKFQYAEIIIHGMNKLIAIEDHDKLLKDDRLKLMTNIFSKKPITLRLDRKKIAESRQIYYKGCYKLIQWNEIEPGDFQEEWSELCLEPPNKTDEELEQLNQTVEEMPALFSMKSRDQMTSEKTLKRIGQAVPESVAYRGQDPIQLCRNAKLQYEETQSDGTILIKPFFTTSEDIENSPHFTTDVPDLYYDLTTTALFSFWVKITMPIVIMIWTMAKEMKSFQLGGEETQHVPDATELILG